MLTTPRTALASPGAADAIRKLVDRWTGVKARERANYPLYLKRFDDCRRARPSALGGRDRH